MGKLQTLPKNLFDRFWSARLSETAMEVRRRRLTYLPPVKLFRLERCLAQIEETGVEGDCAECGIALGGSSILIMKHTGGRRGFVGFDLFGTIPPPSGRDGAFSHERYRVIAGGKATGIGGDRYYGYEPDLYEKVKANFASFGIVVDDRHTRLVKGLFEDTVRFPEDARIAFAHVDCDWHDPVATCLERLYPNLVRGAIVVMDDYNDYDGCRTATTEFLARHSDMRVLDDAHNAILTRD